MGNEHGRLATLTRRGDKMKRNLINTSVTDEAFEIYKGLPERRKGRFVSDAIIEKHQRDTGTDLQTQIDELRKRIGEIEAKLKGGK